ncbi:hypothetical protein [Thiomicrorhabdus sp.]|uniref:tautomerase family protein n=1 Tax=Thiomicrorhabdus sp. TaxID=2039724 RepID=UPI0029C62948|nr:hypothetical protein [Thiomicrorhabdus sp.]
MPLISIHLPSGVLSKRDEAVLASKATDILLGLEGMAENPKARRLAWTQLHHFELDDFYMAGEPASKPHYRFELTVFKGTLNETVKQKLTQQLTELILGLEGTDDNILNAARVWVLFHEIEDGNWGGAGKIYYLQSLRSMMKPS